VRGALDADPGTVRRRWADCTFVYATHGESELGYAVTDHTAQGRTVHTGLAVITGTEDLRRAVPRHRRQPRLRVHRVPETGRPGA
jgi:hypothetical protein